MNNYIYYKDLNILQFYIANHRYRLNVKTNSSKGAIHWEKIPKEQIRSIGRAVNNLLRNYPSLIEHNLISEQSFDQHVTTVVNMVTLQGGVLLAFQAAFQDIIHPENLLGVYLERLDDHPSIAFIASTKKRNFSSLQKFARGIGYILHAIYGRFIKRCFCPSKIPEDPQKIPSRIFVHHRDFAGEKIADEEIERYESVPALLASKWAKTRFLKKNGGSPGEIKRLEKECKRLEHANKSWVTTMQLRQDLKKHTKDPTAPAPQKTYIPALVNSRMHTISTSKTSLHLHRSGAIAYLLDGSSSLEERKKAFIKKYAPGKTYEGILADPHHGIALLEPKIFQSDLQKIRSHEQALIDQMVQYVENQVKAHIAGLVNDDSQKLSHLTRTLHLTQVSLLDPNKPKQTKGLHTYERNQILDMQTLFNMFNGKEIKFTDTAAAFYHEGIVYLPETLIPDKAKADLKEPYHIACQLFNISPCWSSRNRGLQEEINQAAWKQLNQQLTRLKKQVELHSELKQNFNLEDLQKRADEIKRRLDGGESSFELALQVLFWQHLMQGGMGVNCYSGKDRTGYLGVLLVDALISQEIAQRQDLNKVEKEELRRKLQLDLMDMSLGSASQITYENTGQRALKISRFNIMGLNKGEGFSGDILRLGYGILSLISPS